MPENFRENFRLHWGLIFRREFLSETIILGALMKAYQTALDPHISLDKSFLRELPRDFSLVPTEGTLPGMINNPTALVFLSGGFQFV